MLSTYIHFDVRVRLLRLNFFLTKSRDQITEFTQPDALRASADWTERRYRSLYRSSLSYVTRPIMTCHGQPVTGASRTSSQPPDGPPWLGTEHGRGVLPSCPADKWTAAGPERRPQSRAASPNTASNCPGRAALHHRSSRLCITAQQRRPKDFAWGGGGATFRGPQATPPQNKVNGFLHYFLKGPNS